METLKNVFDYIAKLVKYLLAVLLGIMLIVSIIEVIRRYFFGKSFPWSGELIQYLIIWISVLGGAVAYKEQKLVFFDLLLNKFKGKMKRNLVLINNTIFLVFVSYVFINSLNTIKMPSLVNQISIGLQVPMIIPFMAMPIGLGLAVLFSLYHYIIIMDIYNKGGYNE